MNIKSFIRTVPDWPIAPVRFRDLSTLLRNPIGFTAAMDQLVEHYQGKSIDAIAGMDARGFIPAAVLAYRLGKPLIMVRKKGKLPGATTRVGYSLEYGKAELEVHMDAFAAGSRVLLLDDLIATGGTLLAAIQLIHRQGALVPYAGAIVDLPELQGSARLRRMDVEVFALCSFTETE